nr:MAG TPA: hypothetical protein [Caudoviricetes sp.]
MPTKARKSAEVKAAEKIIKLMDKADKKPEYAGAYINDKGKQVIGCMYMAVRLNEPLPVAQAEQKMTSFDRVFDINKGEEQTILEIPSIADLKDYIKAEKEKNPGKYKGRNKEPIFYDFGITESNVILPFVNAKYLLIMIEVLGNDSQVTWSHPAINLKKTYNKGYIFFKSSKGDGILCPVRRADM